MDEELTVIHSNTVLFSLQSSAVLTSSRKGNYSCRASISARSLSVNPMWYRFREPVLLTRFKPNVQLFLLLCSSLQFFFICLFFCQYFYDIHMKYLLKRVTILDYIDIDPPDKIMVKYMKSIKC